MTRNILVIDEAGEREPRKNGHANSSKAAGNGSRSYKFLGLPFTPATSFTCRPTCLQTISCKSNASYDFEPIYEAPAGVINPYERAENEMSLNSNR